MTVLGRLSLQEVAHRGQVLRLPLCCQISHRLPMAVASSLPPSSLALSLVSVVVLLSTADLAFSLIPPSSSPSPSPVPGGPLRSSPAPSPSPSPSPENLLSPLAPALPPEVPSPAPTPSATPSPAPVPNNEEIQSGEVADQAGRDGEGGGMSGEKKAGIAVGVVLGLAILAGGAVLYKRRQDNIRRSRYGYATRMEMLWDSQANRSVDDNDDDREGSRSTKSPSLILLDRIHHNLTLRSLYASSHAFALVVVFVLVILLDIDCF